MDETTYSDAQVGALIGAHYIAVSIDADSDPDLASRYGNWGWPATIVLAANGTEIVKRRGYLPPQQMAVIAAGHNRRSQSRAVRRDRAPALRDFGQRPTSAACCDPRC